MRYFLSYSLLWIFPFFSFCKILKWFFEVGMFLNGKGKMILLGKKQWKRVCRSVKCRIFLFVKFWEWFIELGILWFYLDMRGKRVCRMGNNMCWRSGGMENKMVRGIEYWKKVVAIRTHVREDPKYGTLLVFYFPTIMFDFTTSKSHSINH